MGIITERVPILKGEKESYKHSAAKAVLQNWLSVDWDAIQEAEFSIDGYKFYTDVATFTDGHLQAFYDVVHKHEVDAKKLAKMQHYCYRHNLDIFCYEISADWILSQVDKPDRFVKTTFDLTINPYEK